MPRDEDDIDEIAELRKRINDLEGQLDDITDERDALLVDPDFKEQVREKLGLHWDARDEQLLAAIRPANG
jgi:hypothetical protein